MMGPDESAAKAIDFLKAERTRHGLAWEGFDILTQAQYAGDNPDRWKEHYAKWYGLGVTHLAISTHEAGKTNVDGHLERVREYMAAIH